MPLAFKALATPCSVVTPARSMSRMTGTTLAANLSAVVLLLVTPFADACACSPHRDGMDP